MKKSEKVELGLILLTVASVFAVSGHLPRQAEAGYVVLALGLVFLVQTLLRDLWLIYRMRRQKRSELPAVRCVCLESGMGFLPVIAAAILIPFGFALEVTLAPWFWPAAVLLTLLAGLGLKDFVIDLKPFRIRRDPDHINYRFTLR